MQSNESMSISQIIERDHKVYLNAFGQRTPLCIERGEGCCLYDSEGHAYLDLIGGIAVNVLGHGHPGLTEAICRQAAQLIHCSNYYYQMPQLRLAERLSDYAKPLFSGQGGLVFFGNSGAEANEAAIKLARAYFHKQGQPRPRIVSARQSFHGRTLATAAVTGQPRYSDPFAPLPSGIVHVPFNDIAALQAAVDTTTCAVVLELIQGESGVHPATAAYAQLAEAVCRETGAQLIIDEIQTGMGRTGAFFASERYQLTPDIVTLAKGLGGGVPIGAVIASPDSAAGFTPGDHGSTFGGNPLACAAANAVLDAYEAEQLVARAGQLGQAVTTRLQQLAQKQPLIQEIRGAGLMIGIEFSAEIAPALRMNLISHGYLTGAVGTSTLRLLPPLTISREELDRFVDQLAASLEGISTGEENK